MILIDVNIIKKSHLNVLLRQKDDLINTLYIEFISSQL